MQASVQEFSDKLAQGDTDTLDATMHSSDRMVRHVYDRRRVRVAKPTRQRLTQAATRGQRRSSGHQCPACRRFLDAMCVS